MTYWQAIFLGIIQGFTEFFPISSSAHLSIAKKILNIPDGESLILFDVFSHFGTLLVLALFLKKDLIELLKNRQKQLQIFVALMPLIPAYFLLKPLRVWAGNEAFLGLWLIATALLLFVSERGFKKVYSPKKGAFVIGSMQAIALIPGVSRSASTICGGKLTGLTPSEAVRFSFLLSIPTILGGMTLESGKAFLHTSWSQNSLGMACLLGAAAAFISGFFVVRIAFRILEKGYFKPFAWYCLSLGVGVSILYIF